MWKTDDIPVFIAVVDYNSITAAADALSMPKSTVSTTISRLEKGLGLRLLDRNSRNLRVTNEGETFYRQALMITEQVRETNAVMAGYTSEPSGRLSVALPPAFCQEIVAPNLDQFMASYPALDLDLVISRHGVDLIHNQMDIAVVVGRLEDSDLISKTLISGPMVWVTSPAYMAQNNLGETPQEIAAHIRICEKRYGGPRTAVHINGKAAYIDTARNISHVDDPLVVRRAVLSGAGVSLLPRHYCKRQIEDGLLLEIYPHVSFDLESSKLTAVYPSRRLMSPSTRAFLEFLQRVCSEI